MISVNQRSDYFRDFSRNLDSVMISDDFTDSLVSLLKVSCKKKIFFLIISIKTHTPSFTSPDSVILNHLVICGGSHTKFFIQKKKNRISVRLVHVRTG